jgi:4,5:9,10-diseco-3-hydroxy-5,9,17-trioxoandrosta-1(10),2-diene-4-oate hydrolase
METVPEVARIPGAEERLVTIDGVTWRYWHAGSGPPLLLIHGFMGYSFSWRFNVEPLSHQFSVYAMDLPGCGFSQRTDDPKCTLAGDTERFLRFMDHLGIEEADVVGSSRGGGLAIVLGALLAKQNTLRRIRRLVLVAPINPWSSNGRWLTRMFATRIGGEFVMRVLPNLHVVLTRYFKRLYGDPKRISPGSIEGYEAGLNVPESFEHLLRVVRSWHDDLALIEQSLPAISELPTLLLWGSHDKAVFPSSIHQLQSRLKNSALVLMRGVGHLPYEEVPEEFNRAVSDFLLHDTPKTPLEIAAGLPIPVTASKLG